MYVCIFKQLGGLTICLFFLPFFKYPNEVINIQLSVCKDSVLLVSLYECRAVLKVYTCRKLCCFKPVNTAHLHFYTARKSAYLSMLLSHQQIVYIEKSRKGKKVVTGCHRWVAKKTDSRKNHDSYLLQFRIYTHMSNRFCRS